MNPIKMIAVILIVGGILGLTYGGFSYTKDTTAIKLGPVEFSVKEKETVNVPLWAGIGADDGNVEIKRFAKPRLDMNHTKPCGLAIADTQS